MNEMNRKKEEMKLGVYNNVPIEWIVLDKQDGKALLVSKYCLCDKPYHEKLESVTWETCTLRNWLNNDFYKGSFTEEEKSRIIESSLINLNNPIYDTEGGNDTKDKVFLLSIEEVEKYFTYNVERKATYVSGEPAWWWLRSPGDDDDFAAGVNMSGNVYKYGGTVGYDYDAVRPALWVNLDLITNLNKKDDIVKTIEDVYKEFTLNYYDEFEIVKKFLSKECIEQIISEEIDYCYRQLPEDQLFSEFGFDFRNHREKNLVKECMLVLHREASKTMWRSLDKEFLNELLAAMQIKNLGVVSVKLSDGRDYTPEQIVSCYRASHKV